MGSRIALQSILEGLLGSDQVFFQPPENVKMVSWPAIVYQRDYAETEFADNSPYRYVKRYMITVMDTNPDSDVPDKIAALPMCVFDRHYKADRINHDVFKIFF